MEQDATFPYLFAAYGAVWVILFAYLVRLKRRERHLWQALEEAEKGLE